MQLTAEFSLLAIQYKKLIKHLSTLERKVHSISRRNCCHSWLLRWRGYS